MKSYLSLLALLIIPFASLAGDSEMVPQLPNDPDPAVVKSGNDSHAVKNSDLCQKLRMEMDSLKGRPLRRNAVAQRYDLECRQRLPEEYNHLTLQSMIYQTHRNTPRGENTRRVVT